MKTEDTKRLEMAIWNATNKQGVFGCFEVTIGWFGKERVDYMTFDTKGDFRCYEIKVTKADFHSACHNSFVGNLNYYVLPPDLYEEVKEEIPDHVGVYIVRDGFARNIKRASRRPAQDPDTLKASMIRSLCREVTKQIQSGDPLRVENLNRRISQAERDRDRYRRQYWDLLREVEERFGTRWRKRGYEETDKHCRECRCPSCDLFKTAECIEGADLCEKKCDHENHTWSCPFHPDTRGG